MLFLTYTVTCKSFRYANVMHALRMHACMHASSNEEEKRLHRYDVRLYSI